MQTISIALMISDNDKSQDVAKQQHFDEVNTQLGCQIVSIPLTSDQSLPTTSDHVPLFNSLDQVVTNWDYCDQDVNTVLDSILSTIAAGHFPDTSLDSKHIPEGYRKALVCAQSINGEVRKLPILIKKDIKKSILRQLPCMTYLTQKAIRSVRSKKPSASKYSVLAIFLVLRH